MLILMDVVVVATMNGGIFTDTLTEMLGRLLWKPLTDASPHEQGKPRYDDYKSIAEFPVLDTLRLACNEIDALFYASGGSPSISPNDE